MGNALRLLCGQCIEPKTTGDFEFLGHHGVSAATVGLSALAHDLFHFEITSQVDISMFYFPCYYNSGLLLFFFQQVRRVFKLQNPSSPKRIGQYFSFTCRFIFVELIEMLKAMLFQAPRKQHFAPQLREWWPVGEEVTLLTVEN